MEASSLEKEVASFKSTLELLEKSVAVSANEATTLMTYPLLPSRSNPA
jgi:hypothetical protein